MESASSLPLRRLPVAWLHAAIIVRDSCARRFSPSCRALQAAACAPRFRERQSHPSPTICTSVSNSIRAFPRRRLNLAINSRLAAVAPPSFTIKFPCTSETRAFPDTRIFQPQFVHQFSRGNACRILENAAGAFRGRLRGPPLFLRLLQSLFNLLRAAPACRERPRRPHNCRSRKGTCRYWTSISARVFSCALPSFIEITNAAPRYRKSAPPSRRRSCASRRPPRPEFLPSIPGHPIRPLFPA